jgi:HAMP domain-containing protein
LPNDRTGGAIVGNLTGVSIFVAITVIALISLFARVWLLAAFFVLLDIGAIVARQRVSDKGKLAQDEITLERLESELKQHESIAGLS